MDTNVSPQIRVFALVGVLAALALAGGMLGADAPPGGDRPELLGNGTFARGGAEWEAQPGAAGNHVTFEPLPVDRANPLARLSVGAAGARSGARPRLVHRGQGLARLEPATEYVLAFHAHASSPRRIRVTLGGPSARHLGLDTLIALDESLRAHDLAFRTTGDLGPAGAGVRALTFTADALPGDVWIDGVSLRRAPAPLIGRATASRTLAAFNTDAWTATAPTRIAGTARIVDVPANGMVMLSLERPLPLPDDEPWEFELRLVTATPERVGRISLLARSGEDRARDHAMISTSAVERGAQVLRFPREGFFAHWYSAFRWRDARTLAIRIEANALGPLTVTLEHLAAAPRRADAEAPPQPTYAGIEEVTARTAVVEVETDRPAAVEVRHGLTPAYGRRLTGTARATRHRIALEHLEPGREHHVRVHLSDGARIGATGNLTFRTDPDRPAIAARAGAGRGAGFEVGMIGVTTPGDARRVGGTGFGSVHSYQLSSPSANTTEDARRYLDAAAEQGLRVLVGFDDARVRAQDVAYVTRRVRALRSHPGVRGWYLFDEPELYDVTPAALRRMYRAIRAADPRHPVYVGTSWLDVDYPHRGAFDVAIVSHYPIPYAGPDAILRKLEQSRRSGIPYQFSFQAYATDLDHRWPTQGLGPGRFPTADEMRVMAYLAANHGARGLWAFSFDYLHFTAGAAWKWVELSDLARELSALAPVLGSTAAPARRLGAVSARDLDVSVRAHAGQDYVVAANRSGVALTGTIRLSGPPFAGVRRVDARAAGAGARVSGAAIADRWAPFGVHVYRVVGKWDPLESTCRHASLSIL